MTRRSRRGNRVRRNLLPSIQEGRAESLADHLAMQGTDGTDLERILDGAAAQLNFQWDAKQFVIPLSVAGTFTVVDRVTFHPRRAVYPQGIQHYLRLEQQQTDFLQDLELRDLGWAVFRPSYKEIYADPLQVMQRIILMLESYASETP